MAEERETSQVPSEDGTFGEMPNGVPPENQTEEESENVSQPNTDPKIAQYEKRMRDLQSRADRAEKLLKDRERAEMSEVERLRAELEDARTEKDSWQDAYAHAYFEKTRDQYCAEAGLPKPLWNLIPAAGSEEELAAVVQTLAAEIQKATEPGPQTEQAQQPGERLPFVPSGTPQQTAEREALVAELLGKRQWRDALRLKLGSRK
ncbi:MAG: hypothetical protein ACYC3G_00610 [Minisyncoccota bacterium]